VLLNGAAQIEETATQFLWCALALKVEELQQMTMSGLASLQLQDPNL
jgi:hypothetical protein